MKIISLSRSSSSNTSVPFSSSNTSLPFGSSVSKKKNNNKKTQKPQSTLQTLPIKAPPHHTSYKHTHATQHHTHTYIEREVPFRPFWKGYTLPVPFRPFWERIKHPGIFQTLPRGYTASWYTSDSSEKVYSILVPFRSFREMIEKTADPFENVPWPLKPT